VVLIYEEAVGDKDFDDLCSDVASKVHMHPEIVNMLYFVAEAENIRTIVVAWEFVGRGGR
jgi:hypothetical protein